MIRSRPSLWSFISQRAVTAQHGRWIKKIKIAHLKTKIVFSTIYLDFAHHPFVFPLTIGIFTVFRRRKKESLGGRLDLATQGWRFRHGLCKMYKNTAVLREKKGRCNGQNKMEENSDRHKVYSKTSCGHKHLSKITLELCAPRMPETISVKTTHLRTVMIKITLDKLTCMLKVWWSLYTDNPNSVSSKFPSSSCWKYISGLLMTKSPPG